MAAVITPADQSLIKGFVLTDEKILYLSRKHVLSVLFPFIGLGIATGVLLGLAFFWEHTLLRIPLLTLTGVLLVTLLLRYFTWRRHVIVVTDLSVHERKGLIRETRQSYFIKQVTSHEVHDRWLFGISNLLSFGDLLLHTADDEQPDPRFDMIANVREVDRAIALAQSGKLEKEADAQRLAKAIDDQREAS